jgi:uncharacterized protein
MRVARRQGAFALILILLVALLAPATAADVPYLSGRVVDDAEILKPVTREALTETLKAHEQRTGHQIAVLTVPTIGSETIEEYATRVFGTWKLGQKGKDNGVLMVVVPKDRKMRIEVGYGLEGTLTDVAASRIIRNLMTPQFKAGNFDKGVADGVAAVVATLEGKSGAGSEAPVAEKAVAPAPFATDTPDLSWPVRILIGTFVFGIIGLFTFIGLMTPAVGWFLYVFLIPFWATFPMMIIGAEPALMLLAAYVVGYPIAKVLLSRSEWYRKAATQLNTTGHASIGGFLVSTAGGSSGNSSGGGDSGGFSGGGGDSGGGGASGSW